jgi:hypothetical protein
VVRLALHQLADAVELSVRETECPMQRFSDLRQRIIVAGKPDREAGVSLE